MNDEAVPRSPGRQPISNVGSLYFGDGRLTMANLECAYAALLRTIGRGVHPLDCRWMLNVQAMLQLQADALKHADAEVMREHSKAPHFHLCRRRFVVVVVPAFVSVDACIPWTLTAEHGESGAMFLSAGTQIEETAYHMRRRSG